jgi:hypothetical protein
MSNSDQSVTGSSDITSLPLLKPMACQEFVFWIGEGEEINIIFIISTQMNEAKSFFPRLRLRLRRQQETKLGLLPGHHPQRPALGRNRQQRQQRRGRQAAGPACRGRQPHPYDRLLRVQLPRLEFEPLQVRVREAPVGTPLRAAHGRLPAQSESGGLDRKAAEVGERRIVGLVTRER